MPMSIVDARETAMVADARFVSHSPEAAARYRAQGTWRDRTLADVLAEAGLPDGVLNVVTTKSTGKVMGPLITDGRIRKLSFTGSTEVGQKLLQQSAEQVLKTSMELGGNAPFVVFEDADVDAAVDGAMLAKMRNLGEACTAATRFLVEASVAEEFGRRLADRMGAMAVGNGLDEGVEVGPLITEKARTGVHELVSDAVAGGARALTGGQVPEGALAVSGGPVAVRSPHGGGERGRQPGPQVAVDLRDDGAATQVQVAGGAVQGDHPPAHRGGADDVEGVADGGGGDRPPL